MKIENLRYRTNGALSGVAATLFWEDRDRPSQEIYIETTQEFSRDLVCNPHTFLVASSITALFFGEKRVSIDAEVCPELLEGLNTAMSWLRCWEGQTLPIVQIEAKTSASISPLLRTDTSGVCFSGGIDSLATLRANRLNFPLQHPRSFKDGLLVYGISNTKINDYEKAVLSLASVAEDAGITLIPVYTNIYHHLQDLEDDNYTFLRYYFTSAPLAAVAHAFTKRLDTLSISSSECIPSLTMSLWGTHPVLDPNYSSYDMKIRYEDVALSRLDKTKLVAGWDIALQNLRVCNEAVLPTGYLNCGRCRKCTITMTTLVALGMLDKVNIFPLHDISEDFLLERADVQFWDEVVNYLDLIPLLEQQRRYDLVRGIKRLSLYFHQKNWLKKMDKKYFNNTLMTFYKNLKNLRF